MTIPHRPARRSTAYTHAAYTRCVGTPLEHAPSPTELAAVRDAMEVARRERQTVQASLDSMDAYHAQSLAVYRHERFAPLALDGWLIADVIDSLGEPPIVDDEEDPAFSEYIVNALGIIMSSRIRRALSEQSQRLLPALIADNDIAGAVLVANNAYMSLMSDAATPLMVQAMVSGLAAYYDDLPDEA